MNDLSKLSILNTLYTELNSRVPEIEGIKPTDIPEPYHHLLVHSADMTLTLQQYYRQRIFLRVIKKIHNSEVIFRLVVLEIDGHVPVEFGAIKINLNLFEDNAKDNIIDCLKPLGAIFREYSIDYQSGPVTYICVTSDNIINESFGITGVNMLYGRINVMMNKQNEVFAEVVEILPPMNSGVGEKL